MASNQFPSTPIATDDGKTVLDAVIIGAGFGGMHMLKKLRRNGFNARIFEAGSDFGGVWYWNCYPGARVDFEHTAYQFSQDELWKDFEWTERFPALPELRKYFQHVDKKLGLRKDVQFNTRVTAATFDKSRNHWLIETDQNIAVWASYFILCTGPASKRYTPAFEGLENFKGPCCHTSLWPQEGIDITGKKVAVIGTGASGVQVVQEIGPIVSHLTVYQRTPNTALPMQQYSAADKDKWMIPGQTQEEIFAKLPLHFNGAPTDMPEKGAMEVSSEERTAHYEKIFNYGGLAFLTANFPDIPLNQEANDTAYQFWAEKTRPRIKDPIKRDLLAPLTPPHPLGAKRPSLEQRYYEVFNQSNVDLIDVNRSPIIRITENGVETKLEGETKVDILVLATGFDAISGGILDIDIVNSDGENLRTKWKNGISTNLGVSSSRFPNMFFLYGPQAPSGFSNGPVCIEIQGDWITDLIVKMKNAGESSVEAEPEAEKIWVKQVHELWNACLFAQTKSSYQGSNIPGKFNEPLNNLCGIPNYIQQLEKCKDSGYEGFVFN